MNDVVGRTPVNNGAAENRRSAFRRDKPKRAAIEKLYTEDCTVLLPIGRYVGHAALDQVAGELRASTEGSPCRTARPLRQADPEVDLRILRKRPGQRRHPV
jgi:hypothetical protein